MPVMCGKGGEPSCRSVEPSCGDCWADSAFAVAAGEHSEELTGFLDVTERALYEAIAFAVPGNRVGDIGHLIQGYCEAHGCGVVRDFVSHGIGRQLHEEPALPTFGKAGMGVPLKPACAFASNQ